MASVREYSFETMRVLTSATQLVSISLTSSSLCSDRSRHRILMLLLHCSLRENVLLISSDESSSVNREMFEGFLVKETLDSSSSKLVGNSPSKLVRVFSSKQSVMFLQNLLYLQNTVFWINASVIFQCSDNKVRNFCSNDIPNEWTCKYRIW